jgi:antitoxin component YwqK of YwqJK toxin-antitoxin module
MDIYIWREIFNYHDTDTLKISLEVSKVFNMLAKNILKDIVYGFCGKNMVIMKKLLETETDEDRDEIVNKHFARYKANKLLLYGTNTKYMYNVYYYLRGECVKYYYYDDDGDNDDNDEHKYKDGKYIEWYDNGQKLLEFEIKDGKRIGKYKAWYKNKCKAREIEYKNGKMDGKYKVWYSDGKLNLEYEYKYGKMNGKYIEWFNNGQKHVECIYKDEKKDGKYELWHENGKKYKECMYINGNKCEDDTYFK